jgi:hypothetical protein
MTAAHKIGPRTFNTVASGVNAATHYVVPVDSLESFGELKHAVDSNEFPAIIGHWRSGKTSHLQALAEWAKEKSPEWAAVM